MLRRSAARVDAGDEQLGEDPLSPAGWWTTRRSAKTPADGMTVGELRRRHYQSDNSAANLLLATVGARVTALQIGQRHPP